MKVDLTPIAFEGDAKFSNEATITSDVSGCHRISFLEVDPNGTPHFRTAVLVQDSMLERLVEIFNSRLKHAPGIIKPEHYKRSH